MCHPAFDYSPLIIKAKIEFMNKLLLFLFVILVTGCTSNGNKPLSTFVYNESDEVSILSLLKGKGTPIKVEEPMPVINASDIIEDYRYIPLETTSQSLMGMIRKVEFYKDRIYIHDVETNMVYIYDKSGKFLRKIGQKGGGPGEFTTLLYGFMIDPYANRLLVYDQGNRKMNYFSLDGTFLFDRNVPMMLDGEFKVVSPNQILVSNPRNSENGHLGKWDSYRIIHLDSLLQIAGGGFEYDDNVHSNYLSMVFPVSDSDILYSPMYTNNFYSVSPTGIQMKYHLDYSRFENVIDTCKIYELQDAQKRFDYIFSSTYVLPESVETKDFFWFKTHVQDLSKEFYTYYDKRTNRSLSFCGVASDVDFVYNYILSCCGDYMVGIVEIPTLQILYDVCKKKLVKSKKENMEMIEHLKDDDNSVLVLFKLKPLKRHE